MFDFDGGVSDEDESAGRKVIVVNGMLVKVDEVGDGAEAGLED